MSEFQIGNRVRSRKSWKNPPSVGVVVASIRKGSPKWYVGVRWDDGKESLVKENRLRHEERFVEEIKETKLEAPKITFQTKDKPFVRGRLMRPEDVGMRFEDVYYNRFGIAVSIYNWEHDHSSSTGPKHEWIVVDALGQNTYLANCYVE